MLCALILRIGVGTNRFIRNSFMAILFSLRVFFLEICWNEIAEKIFLHILFCWTCLTCGLNRSLTSNNTQRYSLDNGGFSSAIMVYFYMNEYVNKQNCRILSHRSTNHIKFKAFQCIQFVWISSWQLHRSITQPWKFGLFLCK